MPVKRMPPAASKHHPVRFGSIVPGFSPVRWPRPWVKRRNPNLSPVVEVRKSVLVSAPPVTPSLIFLA